MRLILLTTLFWTTLLHSGGEMMGYNMSAVREIKDCGEWDTLRSLRTVISFTNSQNYLYIDFLRCGNVIHTLSIDEINEYHAEVNIETLSCQKKGEKILEIELKTYSGYVEEKDKRVKIVVDAKKRTYSYSEEPLEYKIGLYRVVNVKKDDTLNLREKPNNKSRILAKLKPNSTNIKVFNSYDFIEDKWAKVNVDGKIGWVYAKYIEQLIERDN